jgi:hypothetical protein
MSPFFRKNTKEALTFVENFFKMQGIRSVYGGGFAAKLYGSRRELADIDINIPERYLYEAAKYFSKYITFGPKMYRDKNWRLLMFTMSYKGQIIDICSNKTIQIFDKISDKWVTPDGAGSKGVSMEVFGQAINIFRKKDLIAYKSKLRRRVDIFDVKELL